jgi:hypothetical protein
VRRLRPQAVGFARALLTPRRRAAPGGLGATREEALHRLAEELANRLAILMRRVEDRRDRLLDEMRHAVAEMEAAEDV